jgi:hypothetical protein
MQHKYVTTTNYMYGQGYVTAPEWKWVSGPPGRPHQAPTQQISRRDGDVCCNMVEFTFMVIAWSFARIFRCGKLGKMTYAQMVAKYRPC